MISAYKNCLRIPELKKRLLFTFGIIALCRLASMIPCPGVNPAGLKAVFSANKGEGGVMDLLDLFSGGALEQFAVGALGIMPYISASIILQLMTPVLPPLERMMREGESGHQKYNQIMRYVTLAICIIQGVMFASAMSNPRRIGLSAGDIPVVINPGFWFVISTVITLTAGAMLVMWLGEMITEHGIGNGASLIITVNIIARLPLALDSLYKQVFGGAATGDNQLTVIHLLILLVMFFLVCAATVALTQALRRVPIRYAARRISSIGGNLPANWTIVKWIAPMIAYGSVGYIILYGLMILLFSFFWVANQFNPIKISDDLQKNGGYIPGIRPGNDTAAFLDHAMTRITLAGAVFLTVLAVLPMLLSRGMGIQPLIAQFFGGTSLLIIVGVSLDTMRQIEGYLLSRHYDGFMEKGHLRSRR